MISNRYDEQGLVRRLEQLFPPLRCVFAAACAQRLMPLYESYAKHVKLKHSDALSLILDELWDYLKKGGQGEGMDALINQCMSLIPDENSSAWSREQALAENAAMALAYALRCCKKCDPQEAAWAARHAYEALDFHIVNKTDGIVIDKSDESRVLAHPLIQAELARQRRDLDDLLSVDTTAIESTIARLRERARVDSSIILG